MAVDKSMHDEASQAMPPDPGRFVRALGMENVVKADDVKGVELTTEGSTQVATVTAKDGKKKTFTLAHGAGEKWKERTPEQPADAARRGYSDRGGRREGT